MSGLIPFPLGVSAMENYYSNQSEDTVLGSAHLTGVRIMNLFNFAGLK